MPNGTYGGVRGGLNSTYSISGRGIGSQIPVPTVQPRHGGHILRTECVELARKRQA